MLAGAPIGVEGGAVPAGLLHAVQEDAQARADVEDARRAAELRDERRRIVEDPLDAPRVVRLRFGQSGDALEISSYTPQIAVGGVHVGAAVEAGSVHVVASHVVRTRRAAIDRSAVGAVAEPEARLARRRRLVEVYLLEALRRAGALERWHGGK